MPYDLYVNQTTDNPYLWEFVGTYARLHEAQDALTYQGNTRPELRRWILFYVRRSTAALGKMHSQGPFPEQHACSKEDTHAHTPIP